jgi:hypothetical protein
MTDLKRIVIGFLRTLFTVLLLDSLILIGLNIKTFEWKVIAGELITEGVVCICSIIALTYLFKAADPKELKRIDLLRIKAAILLVVYSFVILLMLMSTHKFSSQGLTVHYVVFLTLFGIVSFILMPKKTPL